MHKDEQITIRDVRCACAVCGAHVVAWEGHDLSGWCENCGSYDVRALGESHGRDLLLGVDVLDAVARGLR